MTTQPSQGLPPGLPPEVIQEWKQQYEAMQKELKEEAQTLVEGMRTRLEESIKENIGFSIRNIAPQSKQAIKSLDTEHTGSEVKPEQGLSTMEIAAVKSPPEISKDKRQKRPINPQSNPLPKKQNTGYHLLLSRLSYWPRRQCYYWYLSPY